MAWSDDSKRLVVCGEGREKFGAAILWDTGSTVGEVCCACVDHPQVYLSRAQKEETGA